MGLFDIPVVRRMNDGLLALILMILLGGLGTIIWAFIAKDLDQVQKKNTIIVGIIQLVVTFVTFGLGGIWAIIWGIVIFVKATD